MPRPRKWRNVCCIPEKTVFGPLGSEKESAELVVMTIDEYETIRLIDFEGMTQEECSESMGVARTTIQRIYNLARKKLAGILVDGNIVRIEGGDVGVEPLPSGPRRQNREVQSRETEKCGSSL